MVFDSAAIPDQLVAGPARKWTTTSSTKLAEEPSLPPSPSPSPSPSPPLRVRLGATLQGSLPLSSCPPSEITPTLAVIRELLDSEHEIDLPKKTQTKRLDADADATDAEAETDVDVAALAAEVGEGWRGRGVGGQRGEGGVVVEGRTNATTPSTKEAAAADLAGLRDEMAEDDQVGGTEVHIMRPQPPR